MKRELVILLLSIFMFTFVYAASSLDVVVGIAGCTFIDGPDSIYLPHSFCSDTTSYEERHRGLFYCGASGTNDAWVTTEDNIGCTLGTGVLLSPITPSNTCCPAGYICTDVSSGDFQCQLAGVCNSSMTKGQCEDIGEYYYYTGDITTSYCVCDAFECSDYLNDANCTNDEFSAAGVSYSTLNEFVCAGDYYAQSNATCVWNVSETRCIEETFNTLQNAGSPENWSCSSGFDAGECIDGLQPVNWVITEDLTNAPSAASWTAAEKIECFKGAGCLAGSSTRGCGEALVKLPGFSLISLILSSIIICLYYFGTERFKYKRVIS